MGDGQKRFMWSGCDSCGRCEQPENVIKTNGPNSGRGKSSASNAPTIPNASNNDGLHVVNSGRRWGEKIMQGATDDPVMREKVARAMGVQEVPSSTADPVSALSLPPATSTNVPAAVQPTSNPDVNGSKQHSASKDENQDAKSTKSGGAAGLAHALGDLHLDHDIFEAGLDNTVEMLLFDMDVPEGSKRYTYGSGSWVNTVLALHGRARLGPAFWFVCGLAFSVVLTIELWTTYVDESFKDTVFNMPATPFSLVGAGLMFLVVFRTQTSYSKWTESRTNWNLVTTTCRDIAMQSAMYINDKRLSSRVCRYLIVFIISCRSWLRSENMKERMIEKVLTRSGLSRVMENYEGKESTLHAPEDPEMKKVWDSKQQAFTWQFIHVCAPLVCIEILRECLMEAVETKVIAPYHMAMENNIKSLGTVLAGFERVMNTRIPFAYIAHLRTSVLLYLVALPFFLVQPLGWATVPSVVFLAYVIIGLENLSIEIENPFGYDANDLPMDLYCAEIARDIRDICKRAWAVEAARQLEKEKHKSEHQKHEEGEEEGNDEEEAGGDDDAGGGGDAGGDAGM